MTILSHHRGEIIIRDYRYSRMRSSKHNQDYFLLQEMGKTSIFVGGFMAELIFFLYKTGYSMLEPSIKLYIYRSVCRDQFLNQSAEDVCSNIKEHPILERYVQEEAANYLIYYKILLNIPAIVLGLFCGSWSDKIGRKIPIMLPCFGCILAVLTYMISEIGPQPATPFILVGAAINGCFGKSAVITMAVHSYASDVSDKDNRTQKISRLVSMNFFGQFFGSLLVGFMLDPLGFQVLFCCIVLINSLAIFITLVFLRETVDIDAPENKDSKLLHKSHIHDSLRVILKPRQYNARLYLIAFITIVIVNQACKTGEIDITMLFVQHRPLNWSKSMYGYLLALNNAAIGACLFFLLPFLSFKLKVSDINVVMLAVCFKIARLLFNAFAKHSWMVFTAAIIDSVCGMIVSGLKSLISKIVFADEFGKAFSLISSGETASNLIGSVFFTSIYKATFQMMPGFSYIAEALVYLTVLLVLGCLSYDMTKTSHYKTMDEMGADVEKEKINDDEFVDINHIESNDVKELKDGPTTPLAGRYEQNSLSRNYNAISDPVGSPPLHNEYANGYKSSIKEYTGSAVSETTGYGYDQEANEPESVQRPY